MHEVANKYGSQEICVPFCTVLPLQLIKPSEQKGKVYKILMLCQGLTQEHCPLYQFTLVHEEFYHANTIGVIVKQKVDITLAGTEITPALEEGVPTPGGVPESSGSSSKNLAVKTQPAQIADSAQDMLPPRYDLRGGSSSRALAG